MSSKKRLTYTNKVILAPMVRIGSLPFRELALNYGADIVYSEELIDKKLLQTKRTINEKTGTIDYIIPKHTMKNIIYSTRKYSTPCSVLQIGTASSEYALKTALHMYEDYDGLDINMGCPKSFSIKGKMGASLLKDPKRIEDILKTLVKNIDKPITCKIRLLDCPKKTIDLVKMIEQTGVEAIAVHARYINDRPSVLPHYENFKEIVEAVKIPVIPNGNIFVHEDIESIKNKTGASSVMIARGAMWNASIFKKEMVEKEKVAVEYVDMCKKYDTIWPCCKYALSKMFDIKDKYFKSIMAAKSYEDIEGVFTTTKKRDSDFERVVDEREVKKIKI